MPRVGGDYAWVSRVLSPPLALISNVAMIFGGLFGAAFFAKFFALFALGPALVALGTLTSAFRLVLGLIVLAGGARGDHCRPRRDRAAEAPARSVSGLYYAAPGGQRSVDIVIDELTMSHRLDLRGRLGGPAPSIDLADLLLTKLRVFQITAKDLGDALCVLADHGVAAEGADADAIGLARLAGVLGADWGFCHTVEGNLGKVAELCGREPLPGAAHDVAEQVRAIGAAIAAAPKSRAWKLRSRIGERVRW